MGKISAPQLECVHVNYTYPKDMSALWRATATSGKTAEIIISPEVTPKIIPIVLSRIVPEGVNPEYEFLLEKIHIRPDNVLRFLLSNCQEMIDSLQNGIHFEKGLIEYHQNKLLFTWTLKNLSNGIVEDIIFSDYAGTEISHDQFYEANEHIISQKLNLSKRDIRKVFVVTKKVIKLFPRISSKNTPVRGLYSSGNGATVVSECP